MRAGPVAPACLRGGLTVKRDLKSHWDLPELDGALWLSTGPPPGFAPGLYVTQTADSPAFISDGC